MTAGLAEGGFGWGALLVVAVYLLVLVLVGLYAHGKRDSQKLGSFYLAGRNIGTVVLVLTLYATQYSGNSLLGYPGEAYRLGWAWVMSIGFMMAVVVVYLFFAPRLFSLSGKRGFITPSDWIDYRFGSPALSLAANILFILAMMNYLLAQLMAMGHMVEVISGQWLPFWAGVLILGVVILVYESLGGMQAVAWTDAFQGILLMLGLAGVLLAVVPGVSGLTQLSQWMMANAPEKMAVPQGDVLRTWLSSILLIGFGAAVYPQAIQRIFAARNAATLRRSIGIMAFMPLLTTLPVLLVGIVAVSRFSGLEGVAADQVMPMLLSQLAAESLLHYAVAMAVLLGIVAAIMSTSDSVLLSLSSILSKDVLGRTWLKGAEEERLTAAGKTVSWVIMAVLVLVALSPRLTLWGLIELKMEILVQTAPLFVLGATWKRLDARAAMAGLLAGTALAAVLTFSGMSKPFGWHAGLLGLLLNAGVCVLLTLLRPQPAGQQARSPV